MKAYMDNPNRPQNPDSLNLISQTLVELRENKPSVQNPLESSLEAYRQKLQVLQALELRALRQELVSRIIEEDDLSTRFILKLMHDVTEAVCEGRRPAYLMPVFSR